MPAGLGPTSGGSPIEKIHRISPIHKELSIHQIIGMWGSTQWVKPQGSYLVTWAIRLLQVEVESQDEHFLSA